MDVEEANRTNEPVWVELIDYTKDYSLKDGGVSPDSLYDFTERYQSDKELYT